MVKTIFPQSDQDHEEPDKANGSHCGYFTVTTGLSTVYGTDSLQTEKSSAANWEAPTEDEYILMLLILEEEAIQAGDMEALREIDFWRDSLIIWGGEFGVSKSGS